ncbi:MAG: phosphatidylserine decarboxylase [Clostridia bacterium]|nr:phosphatidylserine decarboxylase [Clostridia bacterium]
MEIKVYDRSRKKTFIQKQFKEGYLKFFYRTIVGRILLKLFFTTKFFSNLYTAYMDSRWSVKKIKPFIEKYDIDMNDFESVNYSSFNDFFVRKVIPSKRPYPLGENELISTADSKLTAYRISNDLKINIKNSTYTVGELIRDEKLAEGYQNGTCLVFRLTVDDYHRYHYIDDGRVKHRNVINGILHTVGPISAERYKVYTENHREVSVLETVNIGEFLQVEIGAILVGKIINHNVTSFKRGDEKGYFSFGGSTIVQMFKEGAIKVDADILEASKNGFETQVRMGEKIGDIIK